MKRPAIEKPLVAACTGWTRAAGSGKGVDRSAAHGVSINVYGLNGHFLARWRAGDLPAVAWQSPLYSIARLPKTLRRKLVQSTYTHYKRRGTMFSFNFRRGWLNPTPQTEARQGNGIEEGGGSRPDGGRLPGSGRQAA